MSTETKKRTRSSRRVKENEPATPAQIGALESYWYNLSKAYRRLGGKYAAYTQHTMHALFYKKGLTKTIHSDWKGYFFVEAQKCIAALVKSLDWAKAKIEELKEKEATENERVKMECFTWAQMQTWMEDGHAFTHPACFFTLDREIEGKTYWRFRETPITVLKESDAQAEYRSFLPQLGGRTFEQCYSRFGEPGWRIPLYVRLFNTGAQL